MLKVNEDRQTNPEQPISDILFSTIKNDKILSGELRELLEHAGLVRKWRDKLIQIFPCLSELEGKYEADMGKCAYGNAEPFTLHEANIELSFQDEQEKRTRLFLLEYSSQEYLNLRKEFGGIKKGITIREHVDPPNHDWTDIIKPDVWKKPLALQDPLFEHITAMSLNSTIGQFTYRGHLDTLVQAYAQQKGLAL